MPKMIFTTTYYVIILMLLLLMPPIAFSGSNAPVLDTGQTKCYDTRNRISCPVPGDPFHGQDANYVGVQPLYKDNGNGTVTDLITGLVWQQSDDGVQRTQQASIDYCENLILADLDDWRLPNIYELESIVHIGFSYPAIDTSVFQCRSSEYYSSNLRVDTTGRAWRVNFKDGRLESNRDTYTEYARCVRGQARNLHNRERAAGDDMADNGDGTVSDFKTGLMWQQSDDGNAYSWKAALAYCETLALGDYDDWRLPNRRELHSIIDYSIHSPAANPVFGGRLGSYWSGSNADSEYNLAGSAWVAGFAVGGIGFDGKLGSTYVRCVRGGSTGTLDYYTLDVSTVGREHGVVSSDPAGINCGDYCAKDYLADTIVVLTAAPNDTCRFLGWSGGCQGDDRQCNVTMDQHRSVAAEFVQMTVPTLAASTVTSITSNSAFFMNEVVSDGYNDVVVRGVCWSTSANPTTADNHSTDGSGVGAYSSRITRLQPQTRYYARAYATNLMGTRYGKDVTITTQTQPVLDDSKAILVAGSGNYAGNALWKASQLCANVAYRTLQYQGYKKNQLCYLSSNTQQDVDGNGLYDDIIADATPANLQAAIQIWAVDATDILIYLNGHGSKTNFRIGPDETIQSADLAQWIDVLQENDAIRVIVLYDACESGGFIPALAHANRAVSASAAAGQSAYFAAEGTLSFSYLFWSRMDYGMPFYDALINAKTAVENTFDNQLIQMEANGNGIANEKADKFLLEDIHVGFELAAAGDAPRIGSVSPVQEVAFGQNQAAIWANNVTDADGISRVWAVVFDPNQSYQPTVQPITSLPQIEMRRGADGVYSGIYNGFAEPGAYRVAVFAQDSSIEKLISEPVTTIVNKNGGIGPCLPRILANGISRTHTVQPGQPVTLSIGLQAGKNKGKRADWWMVNYGPKQQWRYLDVSSMQFLPGFQAMFQSDVVEFETTPILNIVDLTVGDHLYFFALDTDPNGVLDSNSLVYEFVSIKVSSD